MPCAKLTPKIRNVDGGDVGVYRCDEVGHSFLFLIWLCRENSNFPAALRQTEFQLATASISTRDAMQENFYDPALPREDVDEALASGASESILCKASCTLILSSSFTSKIASGAQHQIPTRSASGRRRREISTRFSVRPRISLSSVFAAVGRFR